MFMVQIRRHKGCWINLRPYKRREDAREEAIRMTGPTKAEKKAFPGEHLHRVTRVIPHEPNGPITSPHDSHSG